MPFEIQRTFYFYDVLGGKKFHAHDLPDFGCLKGEKTL